MALIKGFKALLEQANAEIETVELVTARGLLDNENIVFVDIRDVRELERDGMLPGAFHAPRGMMEFWVDPESPYHKPLFAEDKKFIFYCASAWRSALTTKTVRDMGLTNVAHLQGGFKLWEQAGNPVVSREENKRLAEKRYGDQDKKN